MKLKKILATLVAVMMLASLAACSSNNTNPAEETEKNTKDTIVTEQPTEIPSGKVDESGRENDHGIADPTSEVKPTDEVTPTEEPTPEITQAPAYDPEEVVSFSETATCPLVDLNWYDLRKLEGPYGAETRSIRLNTSNYGETNIFNFDVDAASAFANDTGFPVEFDETERGTVIRYPLPYDIETLVIHSVIGTSDRYEMLCPDSCLIFVKDGETFDMNALLERAQKDNGSNYTIDQMIRDEYANIICFDEANCYAFESDSRQRYHEINVRETFAEPGNYRVYTYVYDAETQEWHRDTQLDSVVYHVADYSAYGITIEQ